MLVVLKPMHAAICIQTEADKKNFTIFRLFLLPSRSNHEWLGFRWRKMHIYYSSFSSFPQFSTSFFTLPFCLPSNLILYPFLLHVVSPYSAYSVNAFHRQTHQVKYFSYFLTIFQRFHIFISFTCFPPTDWIV